MTHSVASDRRGAALLEVLIASVILATAGTAALTWLAEVQLSLRAIHRAEREVIDTSEALDRITMLSRDSLIALVGWSESGRWSLHVMRTRDSLFDIALAERPGGRTILSTTIYRRPDAQ